MHHTIVRHFHNLGMQRRPMPGTYRSQHPVLAFHPLYAPQPGLRESRVRKVEDLFFEPVRKVLWRLADNAKIFNADKGQARQDSKSLA